MPFDAAKVHNGYFSQGKRAVSPFETVTGKTNADAEASAFELIIRDKERLPVGVRLRLTRLREMRRPE